MRRAASRQSQPFGRSALPTDGAVGATVSREQAVFARSLLARHACPAALRPWRTRRAEAGQPFSVSLCLSSLLLRSRGIGAAGFRQARPRQHLYTLSIDEGPVPQLQVQQAPEDVAALCPARHVVVDQGGHRRAIEEAALAAPAIEEDVAQHLLPSLARPTRERHREPHLRTREDVLRQEVPSRFAQDPLGREARKLEAWGQLSGELDEDVVEERHTTLDRRGHAHLVLLHQEFDEIRFDVRVQHAIEERAGPCGPVERFERSPVGRVGARECCQSAGQELPLRGQRHRGEVVEEGRLRRVLDGQERPPGVAMQARRQVRYEAAGDT